MIVKLIILEIYLLIGLITGFTPYPKYDPYRTLLERTYGTHDATGGDDCGEPLILTPLLKQNKTERARCAAYVNPENLMPGVDSYSGYFTVNEKYNGNLWFWYFPVMDKPVDKTPLILWLQGGPGASSMYGLFTEIGPFTITEDMALEKKNHSWSDKYSLLFIDNPVGTGFSFTKEGGYATNQTTIGENLYSALQQFMTMFPDLRRAPLYIVGESYAGKHVPSLAIQIHWHRHQDQPINLKGLAVGNGFIDPITLQNSSSFLKEMGLIDDRTAEIVSSKEKLTVEYLKSGDTKQAYHEFLLGMNYIAYATVLPNLYNFLSESSESVSGKYEKFLNTTKIRQALHVGSTKFSQIGEVYDSLEPDFMNSAKSWLNELLDHYKVMLYNGHLDTVVPYYPSVNFYKSLSFSGAEKYITAKRQHLFYKDKLIGYYKEADNLLEVMVRGAGHMVPADKPEAALAIIAEFIAYKELV